VLLYVDVLDRYGVEQECSLYNLDIDDETIVMDLIVRRVQSLGAGETITILRAEQSA